MRSTTLRLIAIAALLSVAAGARAASIASNDPTAVAAFVGSATRIGFDDVPGNGGGGSQGNTGATVQAASAVDDEYASLGVLISSTAGPGVAVSVLGLSNQGDARSLPNLLAGTSLNASNQAVVNYLQPLVIDFVLPDTTTPSTASLVGAWLDPTGSRVTLSTFDSGGMPIESVTGNQGQFLGIAAPGIARAQFTFVSVQSASGFDIDDLYVGGVVPEPGTALLIAVGVVGLGVGRRRARRLPLALARRERVTEPARHAIAPLGARECGTCIPKRPGSRG